MREFQERRQMERKIKGRIYSKTTLFVLLCLLILTARGVINVYAKEKESRRGLERVELERSQLASRAENVKENGERLKTPGGMEAEIRSKFNVAKEGEGVIVIVDKVVQVPEPEEKGMIERFWDSIVSVFEKDEEATSTVDTSDIKSE
ncbi:MAG: hypothetical protein V4664_00315 [Patescibacteria group bacterium]